MARKTPAPQTRTDALVLRDVRQVSRSIDRLTRQLEEAHARRKALYLEARNPDRGTPITHRVLADAAGVTEDAVTVALRKLRHQDT